MGIIYTYNNMAYVGISTTKIKQKKTERERTMGIHITANRIDISST